MNEQRIISSTGEAKWVKYIEEHCFGDNDHESNHATADGALISFLREQGYNALADAWEKVEPKWYA